jgi:hypothetical protein
MSLILILLAPALFLIVLTFCIPILIYEECCYSKIFFYHADNIENKCLRRLGYVIQALFLISISPFLAVLLVALLTIPGYLMLIFVGVRSMIYHCRSKKV